MGGLFAVDGKGFRFLSTASDLVILNGKSIFAALRKVLRGQKADCNGQHG